MVEEQENLINHRAGQEPRFVTVALLSVDSDFLLLFLPVSFYTFYSLLRCGVSVVSSRFSCGVVCRKPHRFAVVFRILVS